MPTDETAARTIHTFSLAESWIGPKQAARKTAAVARLPRQYVPRSSRSGLQNSQMAPIPTISVEAIGTKAIRRRLSWVPSTASQARYAIHQPSTICDR